MNRTILAAASFAAISHGSTFGQVAEGCALSKDRSGIPWTAPFTDAQTKAAKENRLLMVKPIAFGTDSGPPARFQGYFEHMETELMAAAGLSPRQILRSDTGGAAACVGLDEVGTIEPGKWADLVVLTADPLRDIANLRTIDSVWIAANRVAS